MSVALISDALRRRERALAEVEAAQKTGMDVAVLEVKDFVAALSAKISDLSAQLARLVDQIAQRDELIEQYEHRLERLRAEAEDERGHRARAEQRTNREFELRLVAENKPREVQIIRGPAEPQAASPPPQPPAPIVAAAPPDPPRTWHMHVVERDPNGSIRHVRWDPAA